MTAVKKFADKLTSVLLSLLISGMCLNILPTADANSAEQRDFNKMANEVCILVNEARAEAGLEPLYMVPYLCDAANVRARECITLLSHTRPGGENFNTVIDGGLVPFSRAGENIAAGSNNVEDAFEQWRNSESHWNAILNPKYTHIGIGICYEPNSEFEWYWTQLFVAVDQPNIPPSQMTACPNTQATSMLTALSTALTSLLLKSTSWELLLLIRLSYSVRTFIRTALLTKMTCVC